LQFPKLLYEVLAAGIALKQARLSNYISNIIDLNVLPHGLAFLALVSWYLISWPTFVAYLSAQCLEC